LSRVGIYGGTFDPIHRGHLHVITQLFKKDLIDQLLLIPAGQPLLRSSEPTASPELRRKMCELALSTLPEEIKNKVSVNPIEILRQGPSYAIDTVEAVSQTHPDDQIYLIVGADAFSKMDQWHRAQELERMVSIICINRPGYPETGIDIGALDAAATTIRQGLSADVPEIVAGFIRENGLYDNQ
jgi:nicotinate-nucleotide adenylyltransferase